MSVTAVLKGLATFVLPRAVTNRGGGSTASARYCYSVYLRHLVQLAAAGQDVAPRSVAEIGPGESVGTGLAALVAGADRYAGLDVKDYSLRPDTAALFDELVGLFTRREAIPGGDEMPDVKPVLSDLSFPHGILTDERLQRALAADRIRHLRAQLVAGGSDSPVRHVAPWIGQAAAEQGQFDWIFSQAVMEHVDDVAGTYRACHDWLRAGGVMSHMIDLKSHGTADEWNGHWAYSDLTWRLVRGRRLYLVNRWTATQHREALVETGFQVVTEQPVVDTGGLARERLASGFRSISDDDLRTSGLFVIARTTPPTA